MPPETPGNPLGRPATHEPILPAASAPEPAATQDNGAGPEPEPTAAQPGSDALKTVAVLVATVDQHDAELDALRKANRANSRNLIMLFGAVVYLTYLARKGVVPDAGSISS